MARKYWLFKSEESCYPIDALKNAPNSTDSWDGVRNYQARNILRDEVKKGDGVLFHHSSGNPTGVAGTCVVTRAAFPDETALDPNEQHFDPKATAEDPRWVAVEVQFKKKFKNTVPLAELKQTPGLENMMVTKRGMRLSIQPVTKSEWDIVLKMASAAGKKK